MVALFQAFLERQKQLALFKHFVAFSQNYFFFRKCRLVLNFEKKKNKINRAKGKKQFKCYPNTWLDFLLFWAHFPNSGW